MLFNKKSQDLVESPLAYYEEYSYMLFLAEDNEFNTFIELFDNINKIPDVKVIDKKELSINDPAYVKVSYDKDEYEIYFYPSTFNFQPFYITPMYKFKEEEINEIKKAHNATTVFMKFNENSKKSYHLQLKIINAICPDLLALYDESAERILPAKWVKMKAESKVVPSSSDIYTVQAVVNNDEVWLHTHGLCRCGLTELEILESNRKNYNNHYNLISAFATSLIDKKNKPYDSLYLGIFSNNMPIVVTCVPWVEGLKQYKKLKLGGTVDRKESHNSKTSLIFVYASEEDEINQVYSKISICDNLWDNNVLLFISTEETSRMKSLAIENFKYVEELSKDNKNKIVIKIGLMTSEKDKNKLEHIWFELVEFNKNKFKAKLIQEPYDIPNIHEGDIMEFSKEDITDWMINTPEYSITPNNVYILM